MARNCRIILLNILLDAAKFQEDTVLRIVTMPKGMISVFLHKNTGRVQELKGIPPFRSGDPG